MAQISASWAVMNGPVLRVPVQGSRSPSWTRNPVLQPLEKGSLVVERARPVLFYASGCGTGCPLAGNAKGVSLLSQEVSLLHELVRGFKGGCPFCLVWSGEGGQQGVSAHRF